MTAWSGSGRGASPGGRFERTLARLRLGALGSLGLYGLGLLALQALFFLYGRLLGLPGVYRAEASGGGLFAWAWILSFLLPGLILLLWLRTQDLRNRERLTRTWDSWRWFDEGVGMLGTGEEFGPEQEECFARSSALDPSDPFARNNLGSVLLKQGRFEEAAAEYRRALAEHPDYWKAWSNLGAALARTGRTKPAVNCYRKALKLNPRDPATHLNLGIALLRLGHQGQARPHLREFLALDPANPRRDEISRWL